MIKRHKSHLTKYEFKIIFETELEKIGFRFKHNIDGWTNIYHKEEYLIWFNIKDLGCFVENTITKGTLVFIIIPSESYISDLIKQIESFCQPV